MKKVAPKHPQTLFLQALLAVSGKEISPPRATPSSSTLRRRRATCMGLLLGAQIDYQLGSYAQAEAALATVLQRVPNQDAGAHAARPDLPARRQAGQGARNAEADACRPRNRIRTRWHWPAKCTVQNGDAETAARYFEKAAALDPKNIEQAHRRRAFASGDGRERARTRGTGGGGSRRHRNPRGPCAGRDQHPAAEVRRGAGRGRRDRKETAGQTAAAQPARHRPCREARCRRVRGAASSARWKSIRNSCPPRRIWRAWTW